VPNALRIGLLGPLQVRDETGRPVRAGGRQLRVLLTLLALNAGRVVPAGSLAGHIWPGDPPGNPGNALMPPANATNCAPTCAPARSGPNARPMPTRDELDRCRAIAGTGTADIEKPRAHRG
jgi:hypothetical protein